MSTPEVAPPSVIETQPEAKLDSRPKKGRKPAKAKAKKESEEVDGAKAIAIWSEDIVLEPGNVRFPIRVVLVDNNFKTRFDRLVQLPKDTTTYIYRVLDHGIPWQHLDAGLKLEEVKEHILKLSRGKELVMYDAWKTVGLFDFTQQELSDLNIFDLKASKNSLGADGQPLSYWNLVRAKLHHDYTGKPGNYDTIQLTDFVMSIYLRYTEESSKEKNLAGEGMKEVNVA